MNDVAAITLILVICITPLSEVFFRASTDEMYINGRHNHYENTSSAIFSVLKPDDKIIYFDTGYADIGYQEFTDALIPICPVGRIADFDNFSEEEAIDYIKETEASYVYVTWMSSKYTPRYLTMFRDNEIINNTLYRVLYTEDELELVPILRMGDNLTYGWYY